MTQLSLFAEEPVRIRWASGGVVSKHGTRQFNAPPWPHDPQPKADLDAIIGRDVPSRYLISSAGCRFLLRRAKERGHTLPSDLAEVLLDQSGWNDSHKEDA